jgi:hypothetical protein
MCWLQVWDWITKPRMSPLFRVCGQKVMCLCFESRKVLHRCMCTQAGSCALELVGLGQQLTHCMACIALPDNCSVLLHVRALHGCWPGLSWPSVPLDYVCMSMCIHASLRQ